MQYVGSEGLTALMLASFNGHACVAEALIAGGADVQAVSSQGKIALMMASINGHACVVTALIAAGGC